MSSWELVELGRRIVLTGWVALVPENVAFIRIVIGVCVSVTMLVSTLTLQPYVRTEDSVIAVASHAMLAPAAIINMSRCHVLIDFCLTRLARCLFHLSFRFFFHLLLFLSFLLLTTAFLFG